jgi:hypothetical protein
MGVNNGRWIIVVASGWEDRKSCAPIAILPAGCPAGNQLPAEKLPSLPKFTKSTPEKHVFLIVEWLPDEGGWRRLRAGWERWMFETTSSFRSAAGVSTRVILPEVTTMSKDVYYLQRCPVCGRMLQIRVNLLGHQVYCQHCGGGFVALDEPLHPAGDSHGKSTADRADELLEKAALVLQQATLDGEF